jgi:hypothetical protein
MQKLKTIAFYLVEALAKTMLFCSFLVFQIGFSQPPGGSAPPPPNGGFVRDVPEAGIDSLFWLVLGFLYGFFLLKKQHLFQQKAPNHSVLKKQ